MEKLVAQLVEQLGLKEEVAQAAIGLVVNYLSDLLPGPIGDQLEDLLGDDEEGSANALGALEGLLGGASGGDAGGLLGQLGGLLGGKKD